MRRRHPRRRRREPDGQRRRRRAVYRQPDTAYTGRDDAPATGRGPSGQSRGGRDRALCRAFAQRTLAPANEGVTMDLTTLERLPLWIGGRAHSPTTTRYGEVTNPATGEVIRHVPFANGTWPVSYTHLTLPTS